MKKTYTYIILLILLFILIVLYRGNRKQNPYHYQISSWEIIFDNNIIEWVDSQSFSIILDWPESTPSYAKDKNHIYIENSIISWADKKSFQIVFFKAWKQKLQAPYISKDKNYVYFGNSIISWANPKTFKYLWANFSKDDKNVFYETETIKWADKKSFQVLWGLWAKDKNKVYLCKNVILWENSNNFIYTGTYTLWKYRYFSLDCSVNKTLTWDKNMSFEEFDKMVKNSTI